MKFEDEEIGGRETGPINIRFHGNETKGQALFGLAKKHLGELKQRMGFSHLVQDQRVIELPPYEYIDTWYNLLVSGELQGQNIPIDKAKKTNIKASVTSNIFVTSVKGVDGSADIDSIDITVSVKYSLVGEKGGRCLGYIVQFFGEYTDPNKPEFVFDLTLPKGAGTLKNDSSVKGKSADLAIFNGYPDNGAKYLTVADGLQEVLVHDRKDETAYEIASLATYSGAAEGGNPGEGWSWASSYVAQGTCGIHPYLGIPVEWYQEWSPLSPSVTTITSYTPFHPELGTEVAGTIVSPKVQRVYTAGWEMTCVGLMCLCTKSIPGEGSSSYAPGHNASCAAVYTQATATSMNNYMNVITEGNKPTHKYIEDIPGLDARLIYRRADDKGFATGAGVILEKDESRSVTFTSRKTGNGEAALFMVESDSQHKYRYEGDIQATAAKNDTDSTQNVLQNIGPGGSGDSFSVIRSGANSYNRHSTSINNTATTFGLPVKVDPGIHKIIGTGGTGYYKVHLYTDNDGVIIREIKEVTEGTEIHIKVGEYDDINTVVVKK